MWRTWTIVRHDGPNHLELWSKPQLDPDRHRAAREGPHHRLHQHVLPLRRRLHPGARTGALPPARPVYTAVHTCACNARRLAPVCRPRKPRWCRSCCWTWRPRPCSRRSSPPRRSATTPTTTSRVTRRQSRSRPLRSPCRTTRPSLLPCRSPSPRPLWSFATPAAVSLPLPPLLPMFLLRRLAFPHGSVQALKP